MGRLINQEDNYSADFGAVFRSSSIFYKPKNIKTTISFSNYWEFKNNLSVGLVISIRDMKGTLILRKEVSFSNSNVINYIVSEVEEGSIEVEAFSNTNLRIPYAAIMVVYETENGVSMVHTYGRNHSLIELEDDKAIVEAHESCWSLRTDNNITNKAVFHNGHVPIDAQQAIFIVTRDDGKEKKINFKIPSIMPFETIIFNAEEIVPNLKKFLSDHYCWGTLHFNSNSSFTRLLILWENKASKEIQVTHSNFDYSSHQTNIINSSKPAYMALPTVYGKIPNVVVYPKFSVGTYKVNEKLEFSNGTVLKDTKDNLEFTRADGKLPARIVTAISNKFKSDTTLPYECSMGVLHEKRPPKRFHWFLISANLPTKIHLTSYKEIYPISKPIDLVLKLYSDTTKKIDEKIISFNSLDDLPEEIDVTEIFNLDCVKSFGYISIFCHYGGLFFYSSLRKGNSLTLEHSF